MAEGERTYLDVSGLPRHVPGPSQLTWWGNLGFVVTEGTSILVCAVSWFYLRRNFQSWPPLRTPSPDLILPTVSILVLLTATVIARLEGRAAKVLDRPGVQLWGVVGTALFAAAVVLRALELNSLNTRWDSDAYGSIVWFTLGIHTTLLALSFLEDVFYLLILFLFPLTQKHAVHITEKSDYALFVGISGLFVYIVIYWLPRFL